MQNSIGINAIVGVMGGVGPNLMPLHNQHTSFHIGANQISFDLSALDVLIDCVWRVSGKKNVFGSVT